MTEAQFDAFARDMQKAMDGRRHAPVLAILKDALRAGLIKYADIAMDQADEALGRVTLVANYGTLEAIVRRMFAGRISEVDTKPLTITVERIGTKLVVFLDLIFKAGHGDLKASPHPDGSYRQFFVIKLEVSDEEAYAYGLEAKLITKLYDTPGRLVELGDRDCLD